MNPIKEHKRRQGVVYNGNLSQTNLNFIVNADPNILDSQVYNWGALFSSSDYFNFNIETFLDYLPENEAEVVYLILLKKKRQEDVKDIMGISQPTVSARLKRACQKLNYLSILQKLDLDYILETMPNINDSQKRILKDVFYYLNQETVAKFNNCQVHQVSYLVNLNYKKALLLQSQQPMQYIQHALTFLFLKRHIRLRLNNEDIDRELCK